jgi:hypothetical protein
MRLFRRAGRTEAGGWVRLQRPERSGRAAAMGLRHRYCGALVMLTVAGPRVVMTQAPESGDGEPVYGCVESVVIDQGSDAPFILDREWYLRFPEAVAGYDLAVRPLPPGGLDPAWLGPIASAVRAEPTVISACAWSAAAGLPDPVEVLGLVVDPALGPGGFDRARESVRERAVAAGLVQRPYGVAPLAPDDPQLADAEHVVRIEARGSNGAGG